MQLMERLKHIIQQILDAGKPSTQTPPVLRRLLYAIEQTEEVEYSCDEVYQLLDQYTEAVERGEDVE